MLGDCSRMIDLYGICEDGCIGVSCSSMCTAFGVIATKSTVTGRESSKLAHKQF